MDRKGRKKMTTHFHTLLSTSEAANLLSVHVNTVRRWGNNGTLKPYRLGARSDRRFELRDVVSLLKRRPR